MKHKKRRAKGMLPNKRRMYQNGGGVGDPVRDRDEAIAFANLLAAERESLDEGEIRPLRSPRLIDRAADLATMLSNPLDAIKASTRYGTLLPTRGQIKAVETPMGAAMQALNPLDDLAFLLTSQASDDKVERAMGPFISLLPLASQRKEALTLLKKIREVKTPSGRRGRITDTENAAEFLKLFENLNPQNLDRLDDVLRESVRNLPAGFRPKVLPAITSGNLSEVEERVLSDLIARRQRRVGYDTGPKARQLQEELGSQLFDRPPISIDPKSMEIMTGIPSGRVVGDVRAHQGFGNVLTGDLPASEMQRLSKDVPLIRVPRASDDVPRPYLVLRDATPVLSDAEGLRPGDVMTSLSQPTYNTESRAVSTSATEDLDRVMKLFGIKKENPRPTFSILRTKDLPAARPDLYRQFPAMPGEDEVTLSLQQPFRVLKTGDQSRGFNEIIIEPVITKYQNGGGVGDPPQGTITPQEALMRALQPDNQFRLTGGDAPFRTIKQEQDRMTAETVDDSMFEMARFLPVIGEGIDAAELAKVAATGEDFYGEEQDPAMFAGMTAAGYLIPNILEKPLKSAWRAVKKFPAKLPKREFRELPSEQREAVLQNLTQAHNEVYDMSPRLSDLNRDVLDLSGGSYNVRQLPSLMSGSKLENAVGKDGLIQVSQIENLINSKDISAVERESLQEVMQTEAFQTLREMGGGSKVDYNKFRDLSRNQISISDMYVDPNYLEYADYGLERLGYQDLDSYTGSDLEALRGGARTNLIKHNQADLMSKEYGHFGRDVIGHYRTFERPDEKGVLYISELQADPLQARGSAGEKRLGLNIGEGGPTTKQASLIKNQDQFLISHILENEAKGADKLRFPTGETTSKIQGYGDQSRRISRAESDVSLYENISKEARENELVDKAFKEHPMFKGKSEDEIFQNIEQLPGYVEPRFQSDEHKKVMGEYGQWFRELGGDENTTRKAVFDWYDATKKLRASREHLSRINASEQATQGIMKGYDRLPKALKKHGLDATKVTDDVGNTWWEVDIPARLGEGVGEIRAYKKGGKFRILKK